MRYVIAKVNKDEDIVGALFGGSRNKLEFEDEFYDTVEEAEAAIKENIVSLDDKTDKVWKGLSDIDQENVNKQLDENSSVVFYQEKYVIIPVEKVIDITSVPKHRR